jgi:hypothetical protein
MHSVMPVTPSPLLNSWAEKQRGHRPEKHIGQPDAQITVTHLICSHIRSTDFANDQKSLCDLYHIVILDLGVK